MPCGRLLNLRHTLAFRLALLYAGIFSFSAVLAFGVAYFVIDSTLKERTDQTLFVEVRELLSIYAQKGISGIKEAMIIASNAEGSGNMFLRLVVRGGEEFVIPDLAAWGDADLGKASVARVIGEKRVLLETVPLIRRGHGVRILTNPIEGLPGGVLQIGASMEDDQHLSGTFLRIFTLTTAAMVAFAGLIGFLIARSALRGVVDVTQTADQISSGDFSRRVIARGKGEEIDNLARAFNRMIERIQGLIARMGEMTDNIAHDLRTPITRIRGVAETTLMSPYDRVECETMSGSIVEECDRMLGMINSMLDISEVEAGLIPLAFTDFDVSAVVRDACELFQPVAEDGNIQIVERTSSNIFMRGDLSKVQRTVSNILDNALKYTPAGGEVTVAVREEGGAVLISIRDTGIGINPSDLPRVFDRFFRGDQSRSHPGSGLGLSLARAFARAHGGDILVESAPGAGTVFTIRLPRSGDPGAVAP